MIGNRAKIDPHSLRERDSTFLMKRRKVGNNNDPGGRFHAVSF